MKGFVTGCLEVFILVFFLEVERKFRTTYTTVGKNTLGMFEALKRTICGHRSSYEACCNRAVFAFIAIPTMIISKNVIFLYINFYLN